MRTGLCLSLLFVVVSANGQFQSANAADRPAAVKTAVKSGAKKPVTRKPNKAVNWQKDYAGAMSQAKLEGKMLLVMFEDNARSTAQRQFESKLQTDRSIAAKLDKFVLVRIPTSAKITVSGKPMTVLNHPSFGELKGRHGIAVIDLAHRKAEYYGNVVSVVRFTPGKYYQFQPNHLSVLFNLPAGTLTQRSMIFAVRIHPEAPGSTSGLKDPVLTDEAASHSRNQARMRVQGHHSWDSRFQRIIGRLFGRRSGGGSSAPVEVVAESWPNQDLMDSCVDCVHSWRQSPGHWSAVQARQASYGYDIRRGSNGIWYATGIFSR